MKAPVVDNNTYEQKVSLRVTALRQLRDIPVVMETHGGIGDVWAAVYRHVVDGVVFDKQADRAELLAHQRPTWSVYNADCTPAIRNGAGKHLCVNLLDIDPYGDSWPTIQAYFASKRPFPERMIIVVNDGLRHKVRAGGAWDSGTLEPVVQRWGNDLWDKYLDACAFLLEDAVQAAGYQVAFFDGYHCGVEQKMTHFIGELKME